MISFAPLRKILSERKISNYGTCFEARSNVGIRIPHTTRSAARGGIRIVTPVTSVTGSQ